MKKGAKLKSGDTIGVIALASSCKCERIKAGVSKLEAFGFKVRVMLEPAASYGQNTYLFSSDTPQSRAAALTELFADRSVKAIISARGAYGSMEVLPHLNIKQLAKTPKCLVGFSDITAILLTMTGQGEITSVHGPMVSGSFAESLDDADIKRSNDTLIALLKGETINPFSDTPLVILKDGPAKIGKILGGSLSLIVSLMGTPWEPDLRGSILFLEEVSVKPFQLHRMLLQLKLAGKLDKLAGVILGRFKNCEHPTGPTKEEVFQNIFGEYDYPVVAGLPAGHDTLNLAVPLGVDARIIGAKFEILESAVDQ